MNFQYITKKFESKTTLDTAVLPKDLHQQLNSMGALGWELVQFIEPTVAVFKRPVKDEPENKQLLKD